MMPIPTMALGSYTWHTAPGDFTQTTSSR